MDKKRQAIFWERAAGMKPDPQKKRDSLAYIESVIEGKRIHNMPSFGELIQIQLQYISPVFWLLQGGLLLILLLFQHHMAKLEAELSDYLWWSSIVAAWMGVLANSVVSRHFSHGMAELEQSCYINLSQMWTIRMILTIGVDICILTVFSGGVAMCTNTFFGRVAVYLLVPFVLSNSCCLLAVSALRGGRGRYMLMVLAVLTGLIALAPSTSPEIYRAAYLWVWLCMLFLGIVVLAGQMKNCYGRMIRGEMICWN